MDSVTTLLFEDSFPREIGRKRSLVKTKRLFEQKIDMLNGADEVFTNVNPLNGTINKIFIDFDGEHSLEEAQQVYQYCLSKNIPCIPIASGKKGIHLHILLKSRRGKDNKEILYKATKSLLIQALSEKSKSIDSHVIGDTRRLCRIPGTLRPPENANFCTYLPPSKGFLEMNQTALSWWIKGTHNFQLEDYIPNRDDLTFPTFESLILPEIESLNMKFEQDLYDNSPSCIDNKILEMALRPCLYRLITVEEPRHHVRVAVTDDLLRSDFTVNQIVEIFRSLNWRDWNEGKTRYQIEHCKPISYPKKKLKELGICFECRRNCR